MTWLYLGFSIAWHTMKIFFSLFVKSLFSRACSAKHGVTYELLFKTRCILPSFCCGQMQTFVSYKVWSFSGLSIWRLVLLHIPPPIPKPSILVACHVWKKSRAKILIQARYAHKEAWLWGFGSQNRRRPTMNNYFFQCFETGSCWISRTINHRMMVHQPSNISY